MNLQPSPQPCLQLQFMTLTQWMTLIILSGFAQHLPLRYGYEISHWTWRISELLGLLLTFVWNSSLLDGTIVQLSGKQGILQEKHPKNPIYTVPKASFNYSGYLGFTLCLSIFLTFSCKYAYYNWINRVWIFGGYCELTLNIPKRVRHFFNISNILSLVPKDTCLDSD